MDLVTQTSKLGCDYKLIFTDFSMPVMDGIESTKRITTYLKQELLPIPVIIGLTGHVGNEYKEQGLKAGMTEVLSKPLYFKDLVKCLEYYNIK